MVPITPEMLPSVRINAGYVMIAKPLPNDAHLTPSAALKYGSSLIEAAAKAEGDRLLSEQPIAPD